MGAVVVEVSAMSEGYRCAADRQIAKGLWVSGSLETQGLAGLAWEATGVEDPDVRAKIEEEVRAKGCDVAQAFKLQIDLAHIVGPPQRSKPPTKPLLRLSVKKPGLSKTNAVFRFVTDDSRDAVIDLVQPLLARTRKSQCGGDCDGHDPYATVSGANVQEKRRLLLKDESLSDLYKQVVGSGAVTDQEFWVTKRRLLEREMADRRPSQSRGRSSSMLADVELTNDGKNFVVNFKLNDETKRHIFEEKPKVHASYLANVPSKLTEKEFWTKYCRHLYHQKVGRKRKRERERDGGGGGKAGKRGVVPEGLARMGQAVEEAEEREQMMHLFAESEKELRRRGEEDEKRAKRVDPSIDLAANHHDGFSEGYGNRHSAAGTIRDTGALESSDLVRDLNRHSAVVVARETAAAEGSRPRASPRVLDDLVLGGEGEEEALRVADGAGGAHGGGVSGEAAGNGGPSEREMARDILAVLRAWEPRTMVTTPEEERIVLRDLENRNRLLRSRQSMLRAGDKAAEGEPELAAVVAKLRGLSRAVNELLRHFWSSFPLSSSHRKEKVERMNKALGAQYDRLEKARAAMDPSQRLLARPLIGQLLSACDAAFTKYDANLDKLGPAEAGGGEK